MSKECIVFGKYFKSVSDVADEYGISKGTLYTKMNRKCMTAEEAVQDYLEEKKKVYKVLGKEFISLHEVAEFYKIPYRVLYKRVTFYGMSLEEAILKPVKIATFRGKKKCIVDGLEFESLKEVSNYYGICYSTLRERCRKGMSVEEAVKTPVRISRKGK